MLCQFTFKNFKSYKDETIFDMQAASNKGFEDSLLKSKFDNKEFLPVSVVYGPNAGGKSNVLEALNCVINLVMKPVSVLKDGVMIGEAVEWEPFMFDNKSIGEPTEFELFFRPDNRYEYEYKYIIKLMGKKIIEEFLYRRQITSKSRTVTLFERTADGIKLGSSIHKASINTEVNDQMPYISFLYINYKIEPITRAVNWFENCVLRNYANSDSEYHLILTEGDNLKKKHIDLLNEIGINISNFEFVKRASDEKIEDLFLEHTVNGKPYRLNIKYESDGTAKLFNLIPLFILALYNGSLLVIDELDSKLHPKLLKFLIMLFKNPEINTNKAQLIFTSHDVSTMKSSVYRTDEIWFACKNEDESSNLYSLFDIRDENNNHIMPSAAFDKQYLEGRYGADPYFQTMMDWK